MDKLSPAETWSCIAAALAAIVLVANACEKIINAFKAVKAPNEKQNARLDEHEARLQRVEERLQAGSDRFDSIEESNKAFGLALLAILDHCIDGNNIEQLQRAKETLRNHYVNK